MAAVAGCRVKADGPDGHVRKHNACRAEIGGCMSGHTYISRVKGPQLEALLTSVIKHRQILVHRRRHQADQRAEAALAGSL